MSSLANRMQDFRPRKTGRVNLPPQILAGDEPGEAGQALGLARGYELNPRSGMISLDLPPGIITPVPDGVTDFHVTVVYLGKDVDDEAFAQACDRAQAAAAQVPGPLVGMVGGIGTFPPSGSSDGMVPAWAGVVLPGAELLRAALEDLSASEHKHWAPHVTLAYVDPGGPLPPPAPSMMVSFTHLSVHRGNEVVRYPIGGGPGGADGAQLAAPGTITAQVLELGHWEGWRHEPRDAHGKWTRVPGAGAIGKLWDSDGGDVMHFKGSLGIDRKDMPQVSGTLADGRYAPSSELMPKFLSGLEARGVKVTRERVPAASLKPTQTTGDMRAVRGIADSLASGELKDTKPVLVSSDNRVIDGHHQWAAHVLGEAEGTRTGSEPGEPAIRADLPASQLMEQARQFAKEQGIQNRKTGVAANPRHATITAQAAPDSLEKHTRPDGILTPERAALHKRIIDDMLAGHQPQVHPFATFFGGGPAAGKSTALKTSPGSAVIDSDAIKARLPEYQQMLDAKDHRAAAIVHEESSQVAKEAVAEAQRRGISYTLDGTGDSSIAKLAGKVNAARKAGYMTEGGYVTVGTDEAVRRATARAARTGRHVPETFIRETHASVSDAYARAVKMGLFDKTELWDNNGSTPKLVASKQPGGKFTVHDPAAWKQFTDKAQEGSTAGAQAGGGTG